ncbi:phospholipase D-like domain-containing protein [Gramella jeungdoensis]|uniref:Phospholipase D-like domain-containing protein n=1 Tax=Gramella jeungdoensis TaxID=708091 RepID=A0ABT0Z0V2_9FLAO|nr:phospholipase D-like domain-containing protein [Gramella jeungdoensis]MCM8568905.1 phospholipase D-like domain-containing protein [Gramella jeungdoensis]
MAKYLDTSQISSELMQLLKEAKEKIILVTYSLQVNNQIQERLKTKSKLGTLSEITIIYGNTKLKEKELEWMEEIDDLRVFQKKNLHAKCYINENKAIISSMNLYDYSQTSNIEMGFLIDREKDKDAYESMMEDIADLKINGDRKKIGELEEKEDIKVANPNSTSEIQKTPQLTYPQQTQKFLLEYFRKEFSLKIKEKSENILSDQQILEIVKSEHLSENQLRNILRNQKKVDQLAAPIFDQMNLALDFTYGEILDTRYQNGQFSYDQVKMKVIGEDYTRWYDTKQELPRKNQIVAVLLNKNWFNQYILLEKTEYILNEKDPKTIMDYSNSVYKSTKELSEITSISSREINSILVNKNLMEKEGNDWYATPKGNRFGALQKEGKFGKFILWPEEIIVQLGLMEVN